MPIDYPLPGTDGTLLLRQGKDFELEFTATEEDTGAVIDLTGWSFRMQVRKSIDDATPVLDCAAYITTDPPNGTATVLVPGGVTAAWTEADVPRVEADWIGDAEWFQTGSDPERVKDAGRVTIHYIPEVTR